MLPTPDSQATRDRWRFERASLLQKCKLLEVQRNVAQAEIQVLENKNAMLEETVQSMQSLFADQEAEIIRLTFLLENQHKQKR